MSDRQLLAFIASDTAILFGIAMYGTIERLLPPRRALTVTLIVQSAVLLIAWAGA